MGLTKDELILIDKITKEILSQSEAYWNNDFLARQIVDDAWRASVDIRFKQHLIERYLTSLDILKDRDMILGFRIGS